MLYDEAGNYSYMCSGNKWREKDEYNMKQKMPMRVYTSGVPSYVSVYGTRHRVFLPFFFIFVCS